MNIINTAKKGITSFNLKRNKNSDTYKATNLILLLAFPIFIAALIEMIQMKSPSKFIEFLFTSPSIILFDIILTSVIFIGLLILFKKGWLAIFIEGVGLTTLSVVELFKYNTNGNHLILTDLRVAANPKGIGNLKNFAYIKITPSLVAFVLILFIYIGFVFWFNPVIKSKPVKRIAMSVTIFTLIYGFIATPSIAVPVYAFFDIDTDYEENFFKINEKFDNNNFLAFLAETTTEGLNKDVNEPENYSVESMATLLSNVSEEKSTKVKPNVIVIMSESFANFTNFDSLDIDPETYEAFNSIRKEGFAGRAVVPTFASFTVKTEFELNFGLPVKSLNDPNMPQRMLIDRPQQTIARYYDSIGYDTNYIHTFSKTFYSRESIYSNFGFNHMYWDDNLTVPTEYFKTYISDTTIFNQMDKIMSDTDEPVFIHATTMQNHQPYDDPNMSELEYYFDGVNDMTHNLKAFLEDVKSSDEPTVVLFIGDHFPCFKGENSVYNQLNINGSNCNNLYVQDYFIWDNYGLNYSSIPKETISAFYLPYVIMDIIDAPKTEITQTMLQKMKQLPIYTTNYDTNIQNDSTIDSITYDMILGEQYLKEVENETN